MSILADRLSLHGRRVLITGAVGYLGRAIAHAFAELEASLLLVDRPGSTLDQLHKSLVAKFCVDVDLAFSDLENQQDRDDLVARVKDDGKGLDVLINNAAFVGSDELRGWATEFESQSVDAWRRAIEVNLTAVFDLSKQLAPLLREGRSPSIINVGSIYGTVGPNWSLYSDTKMANPAAYSASKGGLIQLTRWLATTLAPNIRVNCISPGGIARNQPEVFVRRYVGNTPLARMATEDDFLGAFAYFASDLSLYVTGQNLCVDGGWTAW